MSIFLDSSSLYLLIHIHLFFVMVNFEEIHPTLTDVYSGFLANKTISDKFDKISIVFYCVKSI